MKKVKFISLGCRLNKAETDSIINQIRGRFEITNSEADIYIVNTCAVTISASQKSRRLIRAIKDKNPKSKVVVIGCAASEIEELNISADHIFSKEKQNEVSNKLIQMYGKKQTLLSGNNDEVSLYARPLIKIQDGCDNFCSYCIVPMLRGRGHSEKLAAIIDKVKELEQLDYSEIVLTGVNIGHYKDGHNDLMMLLSSLLRETSKLRIRLSSINPNDISEDLINVLASERICEHIHLSLQSGSDTVLKRMNRRYDSALYKDIVIKLRAVKPNIAITTDIIVGFPGETEGEFKETLEFVKEIKFAKIHIFRYSKRPGTAACNMPDQQNDEIKRLRAHELGLAANKLRNDYLMKSIGSELEVVFEGRAKGMYKGTSSNYIDVLVNTNQPLRGRLCRVYVLRAADSFVVARLVA
ncbi:TPA: tRNA (N(6)-L-threonylcarbamoyladenosine(37)-C(2))-methylthiotransferase MtaB [candidate division CPR2 bacterium]|uniref:tRNA (N(6)-L-threonylcarbamoyladenosine(37)-C(2))-methylthiotransferase n=1 Tax=candidate division CPR2 bacterium GW2011_GWC1_41_48 TaxID=1618344 RepID=A0A0G0Z9E9_UNCC2|nr:MAG: 2-methylthioadenine synthetase [candidate division CPR2 bacterium GW2011_GWC2_39_35]KKR29493.1 MAG: 2-methylthioadenine synthetase [candidate division CPR2 bacterium GW2011_GWD2_39_7]KKR29718.1 MAG: 2-methylthioadenine synthetase [candidate division CPR2 bacterium GW2011_GWD1_39_7]KKS09648.1 MAG: 2-methylthioadenine synthetase [candidate division CPR2 bacterium GW2011_GWC1_41_48]OGB59503.1 MAG: tRNA (N(6)-L-threonylcarbamoyladenosine(37)-C(2))-methylthiotransferase MtaB [candidate divis